MTLRRVQRRIAVSSVVALSIRVTCGSRITGSGTRLRRMHSRRVASPCRQLQGISQGVPRQTATQQVERDKYDDSNAAASDQSFHFDRTLN
jgi:hypothetical protein